MAGELAANRAFAHNGGRPVPWQILWKEMRVLGMGQVHGVEAPEHRSIDYGSEDIQGCRSSGGSSFFIGVVSLSCISIAGVFGSLVVNGIWRCIGGQEVNGARS